MNKELFDIACTQQNLKSYEKYLIILMSLHADMNTNECALSLIKIIYITNLEKKTVYKGIKSLEEKGLIINTGKKTGKTKSITVYKINIIKQKPRIKVKLKDVNKLSQNKRLKIIIELTKKYGYKCVYCNTNENLEIDHIIPSSKGGTNNLDNLQLLCGTCNSKKGNKLN